MSFKGRQHLSSSWGPSIHIIRQVGYLSRNDLWCETKSLGETALDSNCPSNGNSSGLHKEDLYVGSPWNSKVHNSRYASQQSLLRKTYPRIISGQTGHFGTGTDNKEIAKIRWRNFKTFFPRTLGQFQLNFTQSILL